jgi:pimeloyl-ACP methyl ester carboxylesterase
MGATSVFIHGLDSSSRGTKGSFFRKRYPQMLMEDYTGPLEERMAKLKASLAGRDSLILVGSSYGGLMAALFALENEARVRRLVLLAPALAHIDLSALRLAAQDPSCHHASRHWSRPSGAAVACGSSRTSTTACDDYHNPTASIRSSTGTPSWSLAD